MVLVEPAKGSTRVHGVGASAPLGTALIAQARASEGGTTVSAEAVKVRIRVHDAGVSGQSATALIVVERALAAKALVSAEAGAANTYVRGVTEKDLSDIAAQLCVYPSHLTLKNDFPPPFGGRTEQRQRI